MVEAHQGEVELAHTFEEAYEFLIKHGEIELETEKGNAFTAETTMLEDNSQVILFRQNGKEYSRSLECCWGRQFNCRKTWVGSYCRALDEAIR